MELCVSHCCCLMEGQHLKQSSSHGSELQLWTTVVNYAHHWIFITAVITDLYWKDKKAGKI